ncbi:MAG: hypothetical protein IPM48_03790 [Saprospiraceae bacterium]|nr:hypothetical protein [Saprospiraceae bacterium]
MKNWVLWIFVLTVWIQACSTIDPSGQLKMVIKGSYGDSPLVMGQIYDYFDGSKITITKSEFFLSELAVQDQNGNWLDLDVENSLFVNLQNHHFNLKNAEDGLELHLGNLPPGNYKSIRFGVGLPAGLNAKTPKDFASSNPLGQGDHYWAGWDSYIFSKTEGTLENGTQQAKFAYHSGFDEVYKLIEFPVQMNIVDGSTFKIEFKMDHQKILGSSSEFVNIYQDPIIHEGGDFMNRFMDRFRSAFLYLP